jgi:hypothetical protein
MAGYISNRAEFDGDWVKVFRHYSAEGDFFSSTDSWKEARFTNPSTPRANKYSILDHLYKFQIGGKYTFKLDYPTNGITNIWSQTNNPVTDNNGGVTGYTAISIEEDSNGWGGLERRDVGSTFLDGTLNPEANWWYAVGSKVYGTPSNNQFPGPGSVTQFVELWVKHKNI